MRKPKPVYPRSPLLLTILSAMVGTYAAALWPPAWIYLYGLSLEEKALGLSGKYMASIGATILTYYLSELPRRFVPPFLYVVRALVLSYALIHAEILFQIARSLAEALPLLSFLPQSPSQFPPTLPIARFLAILLILGEALNAMGVWQSLAEVRLDPEGQRGSGGFPQRGDTPTTAPRTQISSQGNQLEIDHDTKRLVPTPMGGGTPPSTPEEVLELMKKEVVLPPAVADEVVKSIMVLRRWRELKENFGIEPPRGMLLVGPPGVGKTTLARFMAKHAGYAFFTATPGELISKWVGESAENVERLFAEARKHAPSIVFLDEIESLAPPRGQHGSFDERVGAFLQAMDGIFGADGPPVYVIAATNHPEKMDHAVRSRFARVLTIPMPDRETRRRILEVLKNKGKGEVRANLDEIARLTEGFSGRALHQAYSYAAREAVLAGRDWISHEDLLKGVEAARRQEDGG